MTSKSGFVALHGVRTAFAIFLVAASSGLSTADAHPYSAPQIRSEPITISVFSGETDTPCGNALAAVAVYKLAHVTLMREQPYAHVLTRTISSDSMGNIVIGADLVGQATSHLEVFIWAPGNKPFAAAMLVSSRVRTIQDRDTLIAFPTGIWIEGNTVHYYSQDVIKICDVASVLPKLLLSNWNRHLRLVGSRRDPFVEANEHDEHVTELCDAALERGYTYPGLFVLKARHTADRDLAESLLARALAVDSNFAPAFLVMGQYAQSGNRLQEAVDIYSKAIAIDSELAPAYKARSFAYEKLGQYDQARIDFNRWLLLQRDLNDAETDAVVSSGDKAGGPEPGWQKRRAWLYQECGRYQEAIADYTEVIATEFVPSILGYDYADRGKTYFLAGDDTRALEDFEEAFRRGMLADFKTADIHHVRSRIFLARGRMIYAIDELYQALKLFRNYPQESRQIADELDRLLEKSGFHPSFPYVAIPADVTDSDRRVLIEEVLERSEGHNEPVFALLRKQLPIHESWNSGTRKVDAPFARIYQTGVSTMYGNPPEPPFETWDPWQHFTPLMLAIEFVDRPYPGPANLIRTDEFLAAPDSWFTLTDSRVALRFGVAFPSGITMLVTWMAIDEPVREQLRGVVSEMARLTGEIEWKRGIRSAQVEERDGRGEPRNEIYPVNHGARVRRSRSGVNY